MTDNTHFTKSSRRYVKHGVSLNEVLSRRRGKQLLTARIQCYAALWDTGLTHEEIADLMNRHPSAISHYLSGQVGVGRP